jgi:hypothetical protein
MNRLLLYFFPDRRATLLAAALSLLAFLIGLLDMASRNFASADSYLHLSLAIMAAVFVLRFVSTRASYEVAERAQAGLRQRMDEMRRVPRGRTPSQAELLAQEKAQMMELAVQLRQALKNIEPDSPLRAKYQATLELMDRFSARA